MRTHAAARLLELILSLRYVARNQTGGDRSQRQNSVAATVIFTCHTRRFVAATCRGDAVVLRFVASCVSALRPLKVFFLVILKAREAFLIQKGRAIDPDDLNIREERY